MSVFTWIKQKFLWLVTPFQKLLQRAGKQETKMTEEAVEAFKSLAKPGDILVAYEFGRPTSALIEGDYDHAAILNETLHVIDAVGDKFVDGKNIGGVRMTGFERWLYQMDGVALIRPVTPNPDHNILAAKRSNSFIGRGYDYIFKRGDEKIYCSELPYLCYVINYQSFLWYHKGDEILPQYYRDMCDRHEGHFELIYEFKGEK